MTNSLEKPASRRLACSGCGTEFTCSLAGPCWCAEETARLPMPSDGGDCLCRDCLRKKAGEAADEVTSPFRRSPDAAQRAALRGVVRC